MKHERHKRKEFFRMVVIRELDAAAGFILLLIHKTIAIFSVLLTCTIPYLTHTHTKGLRLRMVRYLTLSSTLKQTKKKTYKIEQLMINHRHHKYYF